MKTREIKTPAGLRKEIQSIVAVKTGAGKFGKDWCYCTQKIKSYYPTKTYGNNFSVSLFPEEEKNGEKPYENTRRLLIACPAGTTLEKVQSNLDKITEAYIYTLISNDIKELLTDGDKYQITQGLSLEDISTKYLTRNKKGTIFSRKEEIGFVEQITLPDGSTKNVAHINPGAIPEYRRSFLSAVYREDEDFRTTIASKNSSSIEETEEVFSGFESLDSI
jgi:hypothetical protein